MNKSEILQLPEYFGYYIQLIEDVELDKVFDQSLKQIEEFPVHIHHQIGLKVYAEGKWTVHQIIQHLSDWERIWCYRTLLAVRYEGTIPVGHNHERMAMNSNANQLAISDLLDELRRVRLATIAMFSIFDNDILMTNCKFYNNEMSALAMGFNIIGHQVHHFNLIQEKFLPLAD